VADLRPARKTNRQAEMSAHDHATRPASSETKPDVDELDRALSNLAVGRSSKSAFKGAKLDARSQIRTAVSVAGSLMVRLGEVYADYAEASETAATTSNAKARTKLERLAEAKRVQLGELRRTINALSPLNATLLKAGKIVHDADLDRLLKQVNITGTSLLDALCEGTDP
jgi:hypothetical protein